LQRDKLHQYQKRIVILTDKETAVARQMLASGDKKRALLALRRKKYQEQLLAKTDAQLAQLEQLTRNVEFALIQKDIVFGLQQGTRVLKEIHSEMGGIEHVEKLMGETAEAIAYQKVKEMRPFSPFPLFSSTAFFPPHPFRDMMPDDGMLTTCYSSVLQEVSEMLGGRITNQDEDDVEDELEALEREVNGPGPLPAVPNTEPEISGRTGVEQTQPDPQVERQPERAAILAS
jgi:charged multivesicular body protein 6